jgi:lysophospholipase L1-like esterase
MNILHMFGIVLYATEVIVSPLASDVDKPKKTFSQILGVNPAVLGLSHDPLTQEASIAKEPAFPTPTPTPISKTYTLKKNPVTIALLGDSMTDTLGPFNELQDSVKTHYPDLILNILNYGVGASNIDHGIERITTDYEYLGKKIPALTKKQPDIIVLESFGYNPYPFEEGAIDKHWLALARAVDTIRQSIPNAQIVIAATIAPNARAFADGAPGISFTSQEKKRHVEKIKQYLQSTTRFATNQHLPLVDAFHPSLDPDGNGSLIYINSNDHIHPSAKGKKFFAQILAKTLVEHRLLAL